jgi:hypothetical protein
VIVECAKCGQKNRVSDFPTRNAAIRCGRCGAEFNLVCTGGTPALHTHGEHVGQARQTALHVILERIRNVLDLLVIISVFLLFFAVGSWPWKWPYGFYILLRLVVCVGAIYLAIRAWRAQTPAWSLIMCGIAILFNPLAPVHLSRWLWQVLDLVTAALLCFFLFGR